MAAVSQSRRTAKRAHPVLFLFDRSGNGFVPMEQEDKAACAVRDRATRLLVFVDQRRPVLSRPLFHHALSGAGLADRSWLERAGRPAEAAALEAPGCRAAVLPCVWQRLVR